VAVLKVKVEYAQEGHKMIITHPLMSGELMFPCANEEAGKMMIESLSNATIQEVLSSKSPDLVETLLGSVGEIKSSISSIASALKK
jgi:hypothetical protein